VQESSSARAFPSVASRAGLLDLQRTAGNQTVSAWLQSAPPLDTNKPAPYSPPDPVNASSYDKEYSHIFQFAFLIDQKGEIHIRPGSVTELSTVTGKPER
jgi:hypothetical protein